MGRKEPWPKGTHVEGWELWKATFDMPGLHGQARHGRMIYLFNVHDRLAIPILVYTHAEFAKRPPEKDLKRLLKEHAKRS